MAWGKPVVATETAPEAAEPVVEAEVKVQLGAEVEVAPVVEESNAAKIAEEAATAKAAEEAAAANAKAAEEAAAAKS